jgi:hypothetical protein
VASSSTRNDEKRNVDGVPAATTRPTILDRRQLMTKPDRKNDE